MTRQKKSRKPGPLAPAKKPKDAQEGSGPAHGKKKGKGQKPGQRHNISHTKTKSTADAKGQQDDPRKGSRRKIPLVDIHEKPVANAPLTPAEELHQLEQDHHLQALVERFEQGEELSEQDQAYLDEKSDRYEQLAQQLGIDLDDEDEWDDEEY